MDCFRLPTKGTTFQPLAPPAGLAAARHQCIQNGTHLAKKYRGGVQNAPKLAERMKKVQFLFDWLHIYVVTVGTLLRTIYLVNLISTINLVSWSLTDLYRISYLISRNSTLSSEKSRIESDRGGSPDWIGSQPDVYTAVHFELPCFDLNLVLVIRLDSISVSCFESLIPILGMCPFPHPCLCRAPALIGLDHVLYP